MEDSFEADGQILENIIARIIYSHHFLAYYFWIQTPIESILGQRGYTATT